MAQGRSGEDGVVLRDIVIAVALIFLAIPASGLLGGLVSGRSGGAESIVVEVGLSIFGLVISGVGFWLSIKEIIKARRKADNIESAISGIKRQIGNFDLVSELSICRSSVVVAADLVNSGDWKRAAVHYNVIRTSLVKIVKIRSNIGAEAIEAMKGYIASISIGSDQLDALNSGEIPEVSRAELVGVLRGLEVALIEGELAQKDGLDV